MIKSDALRLFNRLMKYGVNLNDKPCHNDYRAKCDAKKAKAMRLLIECHDDEADNQCKHTDNHPLIILFSEGKFILHNVYEFY